MQLDTLYIACILYVSMEELYAIVYAAYTIAYNTSMLTFKDYTLNHGRSTLLTNIIQEILRPWSWPDQIALASIMVAWPHVPISDASYRVGVFL